MLIYIEKISNRARYSFKLIFESVLKSEYRFTQDADEFKNYIGAKLNYSNHDFDNALQVCPVDLLFEKDIFEQEIHLFFWDDLPVFFKSRGKATLPFDIFAASFYLVSRYEEYLPFVPDVHGRFVPKESLAFQKGFLKWPLVNLWCKKFAEIVKENYPNWEPGKSEFSFLSTIDVDNIFAYKGKGAFRTLGGIFKDFKSLDFSNLKSRLACLTNQKADPFNTFDYQLELHKKYDVKTIYFMLFAEFAQYDRNVSMYHPKMKSTVKHFGDYTTLGIHPSYRSNSDKDILDKEKRILESVVGKTIKHSRQHFLKMSLPGTIRNLSDLGIKEEFTMGYARDVGFRASICTSHHFYDLELEVEMDIIIRPFAFMDMCFINYKNYTSAQAWEEMKEIIDLVKSVDGELISVWHNRTFSEMDNAWRGWNEVYEKMLKETDLLQSE